MALMFLAGVTSTVAHAATTAPPAPGSADAAKAPGGPDAPMAIRPRPGAVYPAPAGSTPNVELKPGPSGTGQVLELTLTPPPNPPAPITAPEPAPATAAPGPQIELPPPAVPSPSAAADAPSPSAKPHVALPRESEIENALGRAPAMSGTAIGGYGELTLVKPSNDVAIVDLRRLVIYVGHNFTDRLRFYSEVEVEHAVSSATDQGEVEVEQAFLDGLLGKRLNLRAGLILMPVGIVNVYHEPPTFNGVDRPDADTLVIPSTWREPGVGIFGELGEGLRYQLYVVNGLQASGFSASMGVREGHQEAQLARAIDFGAVARLDYEPVLSTDIGLSGYFASAGRSLGGNVGSVPVGMVEVDARTTIGDFTARAEAVMAFIGNTTALNQLLMAGDEEQAAAVPVSSQLRGGYVEAGYDVLRLADPTATQGLTAFARYDYVDTQARVLSGFARQTGLPRHTLTAGLVYRPIPTVALKGDFRRRIPNEGDAFNVWSAALAWMF